MIDETEKYRIDVKKAIIDKQMEKLWEFNRFAMTEYYKVNSCSCVIPGTVSEFSKDFLNYLKCLVDKI